LKDFTQYQAPKRVWGRIEQTLTSPPVKISWQQRFGQIVSDMHLLTLKPALAAGLTICLICACSLQFGKFQATNYVKDGMTMLQNPNYFYQQTFVSELSY